MTQVKKINSGKHGEPEKRYMKAELRAEKIDDDDKYIEGYAAVFNRVASLGWCKEKVASSAFNKTLADGADVKCSFNHNINMVLGSSKAGTLELKVDEKGLYFRNKMPRTTWGNDVYEVIQRGDVRQCSFMFDCVQEEWNYEMDERTLLEVKLFELGPVVFPAYDETSVSARSMLMHLGINSDELGMLIYKKESGELKDDDKKKLDEYRFLLDKALEARKEPSVIIQPSIDTEIIIKELDILAKRYSLI